MTSTASTRHRGHPITVAAAEIHELLDTLTEASTWSMGAEETRATLRELTRAEARVAELKLRVAAHGEATRVGDASGSTSTANWWAHHTHLTRGECHRSISSPRRWTPTGTSRYAARSLPGIWWSTRLR